MVLRAVRLIVQASLLLQVLQCGASVTGAQVNENFENTELTSNDKLGTVAPADIPSSQDENLKKQEERGFFDWFGNGDDTPAPAADDNSGKYATTTPIPGTAARPSTSSLMSKYGSMLGDFTKDTTPASEADERTTSARSAATRATSDSSSGSTSGSAAAEVKPKRKKTKKPVVAAASESGESASDDDASEASASGSEAKPKKRTTKKTRKPVVAAASTSESEDASTSESEDASGSEAKPKKKTTKKTRRPVAAAASTSESEDASGSSDESGSDDLSDLLGSSAGSGSEDDMSALLGSAGGSGTDDALSALLGSGVGGSGSMLSFEDFMKNYGSMFGSGSSAVDLFGDPSTPQNNTIDDEDIILGELYGGKEHGDAFSDIRNIKFGQMILNITVRGQERVDSIGITVMTQEAVGNLVHGGEGGTEGFIEPEMGDTIDTVEVHWDKNKGKTCIFYLKMATSGGKTIATGTKTANSAVIKPPKGYQLAGFHGRASSSGIFCIGGIFTKQDATDLAVTDVMAISSKGSPDIYNYDTTIRNWVGPLETASDNACYQKRVDVSSKGMCPSGFNKDDDRCITQCPLNYPIDCLMECMPQNSDCTQLIVAKVSAVVAVALNAATMGIFGTLVAAYRTANFALTCAINVVNAVKSLIYYLRYKQTLIPTTDTEKLMDKAFQLQIVILDLPLAICSCLGIKIPPKLQFSATILAVVSAIVMMAVMVGEALFASSNNVMLMLRESGAFNTSALNGDTIELDTFLNTKNGTCGYEMRTLTNRVMGKVYEIRNNTPNADADDVRVEVSKSSIITDDIPIVTNHCMGDIWTNKTGASSYKTRNLLRKTLSVIVDQLVEDGTTDMGKHVTKKEKALEYSNMGLFVLSMFDPTGIAWMASEFVQPICGPTEYLGEIDDGTLYDALGLNTVDQAFLGSYGVWKKKGDGSVTVYFESVDKFPVSVVITSGGDKLKEVKVPANGNVTWTSTVEELGDKTLYLDRWRPGLFGLPAVATMLNDIK
ncbi:hypothetical protein PInf_019853 [Phytophthora infestans]|nr:hypothetical protein PInf_019853 [Phytophthora infestans]